MRTWTPFISVNPRDLFPIFGQHIFCKNLIILPWIYWYYFNIKGTHRRLVFPSAIPLSLQGRDVVESQHIIIIHYLITYYAWIFSIHSRPLLFVSLLPLSLSPPFRRFVFCLTSPCFAFLPSILYTVLS
jgi:hypothetical protein